MRTSDLNQPITAKSLNESLFNKFNVKINFDKYTREQLEDARNKYRSKLFAQEAQANFNDLLSNESYQRDKFVLDVLNTRIKEMLGESIASIERQIGEAKLPMKKVNGKMVPAFAADGKGKNDLSKKKSMKDEKEMEGNAFGKAVRDAKKDGVQSSEKIKVGGKEYPVKESQCCCDTKGKTKCPVHGKKIKEDMKDGETKKSSTGGTITKTKTGIKHTAGKNYGAMKQPFDQGDDADHKTKKSKKVKESRNAIAESIAYFIAEDEEGKAKSITAAADMVNDFTS
jgi:hypothetical protein